MHAVRDYKITIGRTIETKRFANRDLKEITIKFTHIGVFIAHLSKASGISKEKIKKLLNREWKTGNKTSLVVNDEKPFIVSFLYRQNLVKLYGQYTLVNKYGTICSF